MATLRGYQPLEWIRTGIPALDLIMGAGIPRGRFIEAIGDPSTAKSGFGIIAAAAFQRSGGVAIYLDPESKLSRPWAEQLGLNFDTLGYDKPKDIPDTVKLIGQVARTAAPKVPTIIVWDSIASTPGADELDRAVSEDGLQMRPGERAKAISDSFRSTLMELSRRGVTLLGINQLRTTMNFAYGGAGIDSTGGRSVKYHAGLRLFFKPRGRLRMKDSEVVSGISVEVEAIKNTCAPPFRKTQMRFMFETGFVTYSGLDELLIRHGRLTSASGWLRYKNRKFHADEFESVAADMPELLAPIQGTKEENDPGDGLQGKGKASEAGPSGGTDNP